MLKKPGAKHICGIAYMWKPRKYIMSASLSLPGASVGGNWKEAMGIFNRMIMFLIMTSVTQVSKFVSSQ